MIAGLDVLNCGAGHISIDFDKDKPDELARAKKIITDMLSRGYTIVVEVYNQAKDKMETHRVERFDPEKEHYIVAGEPDDAQPAEPKKKRGRPNGVPMRKARATGIGQTAGG